MSRDLTSSVQGDDGSPGWAPVIVRLSSRFHLGPYGFGFTHILAAPSELCSVERVIGKQFTVTHRIIAPTEQSSVGSCMIGLRHGLVQNHVLHRAELGGGIAAPDAGKDKALRHRVGL